MSAIQEPVFLGQWLMGGQRGPGWGKRVSEPDLAGCFPVWSVIAGAWRADALQWSCSAGEREDVPAQGPGREGAIVTQRTGTPRERGGGGREMGQKRRQGGGKKGRGMITGSQGVLVMDTVNKHGGM